MTFGGNNAEHSISRRTSIYVSLPNSRPIKRYDQNSIPYTKLSQVSSTKNGEKGISAMPRSILRILISNFDDIFEPHICAQTESRVFLFSLLLRELWALLYYFPIVISAISRTKQQDERPGFPFVGWSMINLVSKNRTQVRNIERGMANLRPWQILGWPSSYIVCCRCTRAPLRGRLTLPAKPAQGKTQQNVEGAEKRGP